MPPLLRCVALLTLLVLVGSRTALAEDDGATPPRKTDLRELARLLEEVRQARMGGVPAGTIGALETPPAARRRVLGPVHDECGECLAGPDLVEAEVLAREALARREKALGAENPGVASCLAILARFRESAGELAKAGRRYRRALGIVEATAGETHPSYAEKLHDLARIRGARGDFEDAVPFCRQALGRPRLLRDEVRGTLPPFYRAGFILSGDWR
jgi:hypothetical protein